MEQMGNYRAARYGRLKCCVWERWVRERCVSGLFKGESKGEYRSYFCDGIRRADKERKIGGAVYDQIKERTVQNNLFLLLWIARRRTAFNFNGSGSACLRALFIQGKKCFVKNLADVKRPALGRTHAG